MLGVTFWWRHNSAHNLYDEKNKKGKERESSKGRGGMFGKGGHGK